MDDLALSVPTFARIVDYTGLWAIDATAAEQLLSFARSGEMKSHIDEGAEPLKSVLETVTIPGGKSLGVIRLSGVLMKSQSSMGGTSTVQARRDIRAAVANPDIAGILLNIDSPGGTVAGTDDLAAEIRAARRAKPVWAAIDDLGASAAYWIASQASKITVNSPTALVGSIGTIQVIRDFSSAAEKEGIRTLVFATGPLKGLGTPGTKITDDQANHVQGLVEGAQASFDKAVRDGRGMSAKELATVRHGGVMNAETALGLRLVDAIQPLQKTMNDFAAFTRAPPDRRSLMSLPMVAASTLPMLSGE